MMHGRSPCQVTGTRREKTVTTVMAMAMWKTFPTVSTLVAVRFLGVV